MLIRFAVRGGMLAVAGVIVAVAGQVLAGQTVELSGALAQAITNFWYQIGLVLLAIVHFRRIASRLSDRTRQE
jgi:hypothetical protein